MMTTMMTRMEQWWKAQTCKVEWIDLRMEIHSFMQIFIS